MKSLRQIRSCQAPKATPLPGLLHHAAFAKPCCRLTCERGNVLVYVIMTMLIFAALGVSLVSLFTATSSSTAPPNQARRALYLKESGLRYAVSELRNTGFDDDVLEALNTTTFDLQNESSFTLNVFSPWFEADETKTIPDVIGGTLLIKTANGKLHPDWIATNPDGIWVVNFDYIQDIKPRTARDGIQSWVFPDANDPTKIQISVGGDFDVREGDRICLAVTPKSTQTISSGGDLLVEAKARLFFPKFNGAINVNRIDYVYAELIHEQANDRVRLRNITATGMPNPATPFPLTVEEAYDSGYWAGDFVVLSPRNQIIVPTGRSGNVVTAGALEDSLNAVDFSTINPMSARADIDAEIFTSNISKKETTSDFIDVDTTDNTIDVGGGGSTDSEFGAAWYGGDLTLGGSTNFCQAGACRFGRGIRAFFLLNYSGSGEGLTFSLLNGDPNLNTANSVGGDRDLPELLAYAGDSRLDSAGTSFLDGSGTGLRPPKMALEFDARPSNSTFAYCSGSTANQGTRNDPGDGGRDALQYVFWGFDASLAIGCRGNKVSYDDNRHDSGEGLLKWSSVSTFDKIRSTPAVGPNGTIYVGSTIGRLYAFNPDGSLKWFYSTIGAVYSSPVVGTNGVVYVGSDGGYIYGIDAVSGAKVYEYFIGAAYVRGSPVIGPGGKVYVGAENNKFYGFSASLSKLWEFTMAGPPSYGRPPISPSGMVYVSHRADANGWVYALNPSQRESGASFPSTGEWRFSLGSFGAANDRMPGIDPATGNILTDAAGNKIVAIRPTGTQDWEWVFGGDFDSTPVVGPDGTVYFGTDNSLLLAVNPEDRKAGRAFPTAREWTGFGDSEIDTTPAIAPDGTVVAHANSGNFYAWDRNGTLKWFVFLPVSPVFDLPNSSPAIGSDGTIYIGSSDNKLYAYNNFAVPRNFRDKLVTAVPDGAGYRVGGESVSLSDPANWLKGSSSRGPWAVRMEVDRSLNPNGSGKYEYTLRSWVRQCEIDPADPTATCYNVLGSFFEDTRIRYEGKTPHIEQTIELDATQHDNLTRFLFGYTGAVAAGSAQSALIDNFRLSFIRFSDPVITSDPDWP